MAVNLTDDQQLLAQHYANQAQRQGEAIQQHAQLAQPQKPDMNKQIEELLNLIQLLKALLA